MTSYSVVLIDANRLFREGLGRILSGSAFAAVHQSSSVEDALPLIVSLQPSVVLVGSLDAGAVLATRTGEIRAAAPQTRIVMLTDSVGIDRLAEALSARVDGYLSKNMSADALQQSLRLVLLGEKVFPIDLANLLTNRRIVSEDDIDQGSPVNGLSARERQILSCLLNGAQNKQIANDLEISDGTVKVHVKAILKKIGARNRTQAALWALSNGMREVGPNLLCRRSPQEAMQSKILPNAVEIPIGN